MFSGFLHERFISATPTFIDTHDNGYSEFKDDASWATTSAVWNDALGRIVEGKIVRVPLYLPDNVFEHERNTCKAVLHS